MGDRGYYTGRGKGASSPIFRMDPTAPRIISTERGLGYVFALPVEPPRGGSPERSPTAASARISRTPRFIAFVAHLLAAEITL
jgi:hypothetical protein